MSNQNRFFNAVRNQDTLTLSIYDAIGADFFGSGITASQVQSALDGDHKNVTVRVNSPGGDAFEGVAIYNVLKSSKKPVNVIVDGLAASAASIICMAGETVTMNEGSMMMIHDAQGMAMGNSDDMRKLADTLDQVTGSIADIYAGNTTVSKDDILNLMHAETWMNAGEAHEKGFATAVSQNPKVSNSFDLSHFKNTPKEIQEKRVNVGSLVVSIDTKDMDEVLAKHAEAFKNNAKTKEVAGEHLTAGDFVYVGNPDDVSTWSLPWHFSTEEKTKSHLRDALARFDQDKVIPKSHRAEAYAKLVRLCKEHGIEVGASNSVEPIRDYEQELDIKMRQIEINRRK